MLNKPSYNKAAGRFNLLLLDEGEYYFEDFSVFYYPPGVDDKQAVKRRIKGRLNLCSASLIFDPEDTRLPLVKLPYKYIDFIREYQGGIVKELPTKADLFIIKIQRTVRMKENNLNTPYIFKEEPEEFIFSLTYVSKTAFLPRVSNLINISRLTNSAVAENELRTVIDTRENGIPFDKSAIVDINEGVLHETSGIKVTPLVSNPGRILITNAIIYFQPFNNISVQPVEKYKISSVIRVAKRRYVLRHVGIEIFMHEDESIFLAFKSKLLRDTIYATLLAQPDIKNSAKLEEQSNITLRWQNGLVSNYDYLVYLNSIAGRTFSDITQYPVFPWVIADYTSRTIDLSNPKTYRDLSKPIGALNPDRLAMLLERMKQMPEPKFLYGTHYSTPGYVLFYLVRAAPEYILRLQNGRYDAPNRMFHSMAETWQGVLTNAADVKELTPEFYHGDGSFLINSERLNFGKKENGQTIDDVVLPPWASDAANFVKICRDALESDYVSENLHNWIDLIFGYKQQGPEAVKSHNLFYHLTYEGAVDIEGIQDAQEKAAIIAQIKEFGQTPRQLFGKPHASRLPKDLRSTTVLPPTSATTTELEINIPLSAEPLESLIIKPLFDTWGPLKSLELDFSFKLHKDTITALCVSADGNTVFTVSQDSSLKVYSVSEKKQLRSTNICDLTLSACQLSPDEKTVIVGAWDNNIYLYSVGFGSVIDTLSAHDDAVSCLCLRKDLLVSGSWDASVKVWQFKGNSLHRLPLAEFTDHDTEIHCVDVDTQCTVAASGAADGSLALYDLKTKSHIRTLEPHTDIIHAVQFTPDGSRIVTCSSDGFVKVLELGGTEIFAVDLTQKIKCLRTDGENLFLGGIDGILRLWTLKVGAELKQFKGAAEEIGCVGVAKDGSTVAIGASNTIRVYRRKSGNKEEED